MLSPVLPKKQPMQKPKAPRDWAAEQARYCDALSADRLDELATELGVRSDAITAISVGWCDAQQCWTMPEYGVDGSISGINRRFRDGQKQFFQGGRRGLTIPGNLSELSDPILVCEGASDVAACLSMGLTAIGRYNNLGGGNMLAEFLRGRDVIVMGENDQKENGSWPGHDGATRVSQKLANAWQRPVKWSLPPDEQKDVRTWLQSHEISLDDIDALHEAGQRFLNAVRESAEAINPEPTKTESPKESQATQLVKIARAECKLFHNRDGDCFASMTIDGHRETHSLKSQKSKDWLGRRLFETIKKTPGSQSLQDATNTLGGFASFDGERIETHVRIAQHEDAIYLDLCDDRWQAIEIDSSGWRVVETPPVHFTRPRGLTALPEPLTGGGVDLLRDFINIESDDEFNLLLAYLVHSLQPTGPYTVLVLNGQQGSGKSTASEMIRSLVDPSIAPLRSAPRDQHDLMIAASNGRLVCYDNLSTIPYWLSDALCRLSTGGGMSCRKLYSDNEETLFFACLPILINGIDSLTERSDLISRVVRITLPTLDRSKCKQPSILWEEFERARPRILGALLDAVSCALKNFDSVELPELPRMADFAVWTVAAAPALGFEGEDFLRAYNQNRADDVEIALDGSIVAPVLRAWIAERGSWSGTASDLLELLTQKADNTANRKGWPSKANSLSGQLKRLAPNFRAVGIEIAFGRETSGIRQITVKKCPTDDHRRSFDDQLPYSSSKITPTGAIENAENDDLRRSDDPDDEKQTLSKEVAT